jgi:nucleolar MIF4G domain-containing protein 1
MKSNARLRKGGSATTAAAAVGGIVVEASNRKARRKEQRRAKKGKPRRHDGDVPPRDDGVIQPGGTAKKNNPPDGANDVSDRNPRSNKRIKLSKIAVGEKFIPPVKNPKSPSIDSSDTPHDKRKNRYDKHLDDETLMALRQDDREIEYLESNLGYGKSNNKRGGGGARGIRRELNREYAKNEGFGDDFGDFLMELDDLVVRCVGGGGSSASEGSGDDDESESEFGIRSDDDNASIGATNDDENDADDIDSNTESDSKDEYDDEHDQSLEKEESCDSNDDPYANIDEDVAFALRNDDAEIAALEQKLGLSANSTKAKKKLRREYASAFSGYGEDFGDFLDDLDRLDEKIGTRKGGEIEQDSSLGEDDTSMNSEENDSNSIDDSNSETEDMPLEDAADHDVSLTYRPTIGEDIYGNKIDSSRDHATKPSKYLPPHLRNQRGDATTPTDEYDGDLNSHAVAADPETITLIHRQINNALNRLSDQTLESVSKSIALIYSTYPFRDVNDCLWKNIQSACISPHMIMSGLVPLYIGAIAGVHWLGGDGIQIGGCLVEWSVTNLFDSLKMGRGYRDNSAKHVDEEEHTKINKEASNLILIVCYLYNYGVIHCTLIYDLVRDFIRNFSEIDVEGLLIILSHCGQQLRSDDPTALREIVLMVKDRAQTATDKEHSNLNKNAPDGNTNVADSSRVQYMVDSITELKNNKPRKQDAVIREKSNALKKHVGRIKTSASQSLAGKKSGSCLRVTLQDVLDAEVKGRWWMVGATWTGNQHHDKLWGDPNGTVQRMENADVNDREPTSSSKKVLRENEDILLALASSQRMNTDARRSIFCIVMGSTDCDDAFEKLVRGGMLKPKIERDVIRVLIHCCGEEKAYNPFYAYLATRCCEYQAKSRFTLMLTFWDAFKQLDTFSARKVANLAKLLAHFMVSADKCVTIGVLKRIDFSPTDMSEMVIIFLSILMTAIFESCDVENTRKIFNHGTSTTDSSSAPKSKRVDSDDDDDNDEDDAKSGQTKKEDLTELRENLSIFLLQYMKPSPKNAKGSKFRSNLLAAISSCEKSSVAF